MKITLTGSLGHIGKPLTEELVQKGHAVTVISHNPEKKSAIGALGATPAIGSVEDVDFLTTAFAGADAVYTMLPPGNYFDQDYDIYAKCDRLANNFAQAIRQSGVKRLVHLSSIGAHLEKGSGLILLHRHLEITLGKLADVAITFMRPTAFYYNLYGYVPMIKKAGFIAANYGADDKMVWVSPKDIATAIAEEIVTPLTGRKIRYVASDELTCNEVAHILGAAIGKPDLQWMIIPGEQMQSGMIAAGMNPDIVAGLVEMYACVHSGELGADYFRNRPAVLGKIKMTDFAREFAVAYNQK
ncbi:NAD(P)H-binding protein [Puia dinghuensis]|uniref:NAD(P)-binding domain-containing protein n=1 Tax=Puia dinghuensis TaxID=1792502 RepID=A0A8J2XWK0_9BACT|nr:NAD(P)H-binding protein [Puia dinghuensis]GGB24279.1 hypothetical protein GCM10011511_55230 [Puia dinghuensis]